MDNVIVDADDFDGVRTSASQNRATSTLCTEEFFLRTRYIQLSHQISRERGGGRIYINGQCDTYIEGPG